jgi:chemotaxis response regulator CheB
MPLRIFVADDSEAIREAVRCCIETNTNWKVCGEAENGSVALDMVRELNPPGKSQRLLHVQESSCSWPTIVSSS